MNLRVSVPVRLRSLCASITMIAIGGCAAGEETVLDETVACPSSGPSQFTALTLAPGIDGIEFRAVQTRAGGEVETFTPIGTPCKTASDHAACLKKVQDTTASANQGWVTSFSDAMGPGNPRYGVATRGDEVLLVTKPDALAKLLAPLDTPARALAFLKVTKDDGVSCGPNNASRRTGGYLFKTVESTCGGGKYETIYAVASDGTITETSRTLESGNEDVDC